MVLKMDMRIGYWPTCEMRIESAYVSTSNPWFRSTGAGFKRQRSFCGSHADKHCGGPPMRGAVIAVVFALFTFGCALIGLWARRFIASRLTDEAKDIIGRVSGLMATVIGLVLGLLVSSSYSFYSSERAALDRLASQMIELNDTLVAYGPEANSAREALRSSMHEIYDRLNGSSTASAITERDLLKRVSEFFRLLEAKTAQQTRLFSHASQLWYSISETGMLVSLHQFNTLPVLFVIILGSWTGALFFGFGLLGRPTVGAVLFLAIGAATIASALFLIQEMTQPYSGVFKISLFPIEQAIIALDR
jgi:hypothetical protein